MNNDFRNFAVHHLGMNGLALDQYASQVMTVISRPQSLRNVSSMLLRWMCFHAS